MYFNCQNKKRLKKEVSSLYTINGTFRSFIISDLDTSVHNKNSTTPKAFIKDEQSIVYQFLLPVSSVSLGEHLKF